jgi:hypothetical protein
LSELNIDSSSGCFIKYTFPGEIDATDLDLNAIEGKGMLVDSTGAISLFSSEDVKHNLDSGELPQWIALPGC